MNDAMSYPRGRWSPEFTPGQLALITIDERSGHDPGPVRATWSPETTGWNYYDKHATFRYLPDRHVVQALPLVVLDPALETNRSALRAALQYVRYELNDPQQDLELVLERLAGQPVRVPPKPPEPRRMLAVVADNKGQRWTLATPGDSRGWAKLTMYGVGARRFTYSAINAVRVDYDGLGDAPTPDGDDRS